MKNKNITKKFTYLFFFVIVALTIFSFYQYFFNSLQETFILLNGDGEYKIDNENHFQDLIKPIKDNINSNYSDIELDNSLNTSMYFKRLNNEDIYYYNDNNMYHWDSSTIKLYKSFLNSQKIVINDEDFDTHVNKLRTIYNQNMILELMSHETNRHKFLTNGVIVDGSNNLLEPWNEATMTLTGSQYIVKCDGVLKKYSSPSDQGTEISLSTLHGLEFPDGECNICDGLLSPDNTNRYKCKYNLNMKKNIGLSGNGIWNKLWNII